MHQRPDGTAKRNFNENKERFILGEDYFSLTFEEARSTNFVPRPNSQGLTLITKMGYLMLVKSLNDDLAWHIQRQLVKNYFERYDDIGDQRIGAGNILSPIVVSYLQAIKKAIDGGEYYLLPKSKKKGKEVNQSGALLGVYDEFCYYLFSNTAYEIYAASTTEPVNRKAIYAIMADNGIIRKGATESTEPKCIKGITRTCIVIYKDKVKGLL